MIDQLRLAYDLKRSVTASEYDAAYQIALDHTRYLFQGDRVGLEECKHRRENLLILDRIFRNVYDVCPGL
jgi:hypothetical protein